jgi:putative transposase
MPRKPRPLVAGAVYHIFNRGVVKLPIFADDADRRNFLNRLADVVQRHSWRCLGYCLMGNHFHLVLQTPSPDLADGMRRLQSGYAQDFNWRNERAGHLFQSRYGASVLQTEEEVRRTIRYVALNPVRASLCAEPEEWRWSSHRAIAGGVVPPPYLAAERALRLFGDGDESARRTYAAFIDAPN